MNQSVKQKRVSSYTIKLESRERQESENIFALAVVSDMVTYRELCSVSVQFDLSNQWLQFSRVRRTHYWCLFRWRAR